MTRGRGLLALLFLFATAQAEPTAANVITDLDEIVVKSLQPIGSPPAINPGLLFRATAMTNIAMFNAVNSIDPHYRGYLAREATTAGASLDAAAAAAAATVLMAIVPKADVAATLTAYLATLPDGDAKARGVKVGEDAGKHILELRANDGSKTPSAYRPSTAPGVYVGTAPVVGWETIAMTPFAMAEPSQFRPGPPPDLKSEQWAKDYNEIKELGGKYSTKRTAQQTEDARFWLTTGPLSTHAFERQIVAARKMSVIDSARFMALLSIAEADAIQAVYEAKFHYQFWRPVTAIRNGDVDGNPDTERQADWEPIDLTPAHPEYPCAHCIVSMAVATIIAAEVGGNDIPEVAIAMPSAPGVTHRFTSLDAFTQEVANARIYAGFHYRNSTVVGQDMGKQIGAFVLKTVLQPLN